MLGGKISGGGGGGFLCFYVNQKSYENVIHSLSELYNLEFEKAFTGALKDHGVQISMDGKGRCMDNIFIERLWRSVKYEKFFLEEFETVPELLSGL